MERKGNIVSGLKKKNWNRKKDGSGFEMFNLRKTLGNFAQRLWLLLFPRICKRKYMKIA